MDLAANIGMEYGAFEVVVEAERIRDYATAIGETDPIHHQEEAAQKAGYRSILAPLTFPFTIVMDAAAPFAILDQMGIDKTKTVHGEQGFRSHRPICAGDQLRGRQWIADIQDRKGGALTFIITETALTNPADEPVCDLRSVIVVRNR